MKRLLVTLAAIVSIAAASAQDDSSNSGVRRRDTNAREEAQGGSQVTQRMRSLYGDGSNSLSEGDVQWMRVIYRQIDLDKDQNAALYFPEDLVDGQENFFRILMRLLANNEIKAYEYLDGREIFTDQYRINVKDLLDRFYIPYAPAKGSSEKNPKYEIEESDVPTTEVLSYYVIERWEFDNRNNRMKTYVDAICPVLHRAGDFGGEPLKYPMFWVKFSDIRPYLANQQIFISDDNNLPTCTYDDFFNLNMYQGDIYKTRNLRNRSLMQMFPDPDDMARAQDSIQKRLESFEDRLWVPDREEIIAAREAREAAEAKKEKTLDDVLLSDSTDEAVPVVATDKKSEKKSARTSRGAKSEKNQDKKKTAKPKVSKAKTPSGGNSSATRSVRRKR